LREKAEAERRELERQARAERARITALLRQAHEFSRADTIRKYVETVRIRVDGHTEDHPVSRIETWAVWALSRADAIDPTKNGALVSSIEISESELTEKPPKS
jgi:ABC-type cobalamin/Fe3+-siderophores transport system ATPase subunit